MITPHLTLVPEQERGEGVSHLSDAERLSRQLPTPDALVISHLERDHSKGNAEVFDRRRVIALLSGMIDGDPHKFFTAVSEGYRNQAEQQPAGQPIESNLGDLALTTTIQSHENGTTSVASG